MIKFSHFLLGYVAFLLLGAFIFYELNSIEERKRHIEISAQIREFLYRNRKCLKEQDLYSYVDYFLDKSHTGLWHSSLARTNITKWTFGQGLFFTTSLLTTVGYGTPNLITAYGKIVCIVYTSIGLILALLFQQILHRRLLPVLFRVVFRLSLYPRIVASSSKRRSYLLSFLLVTSSLSFVFLILPTLMLHQTYVPHWSLIELTYFAVTTNQMIGLGDLMPCGDLQGQSRSTCAMITTVYVIVQVLVAGLLSHMWLLFPSENRRFANQRRHPSDPTVEVTTRQREFSIDLLDENISDVFT